PDAHRWHAKLAAHWEPGERGAWSRAERFIEAAVARYHEGRDHPAEPLTSRLSAHLHCGEITAAQLYARLQPCLQGGLGAAATRGAARFLDELLWREFAHHVLWHFPHSAQRSLDARYERGVWGDDATLLARWQRGETGMPLVDAGMHELWASGWMHNRVRMVAASYLTKQMGLHWRHGAAWFWDTLVDADLANNSLGWQWVAGCGVDAAPYYRIFNPELQAQKFDPDGRYRARWLPASYRRRPPPPLLDPGAARAAALQRYQQYVKQES
ncbi:MAG TPA: FAD-binding domain-containing protein, partial [Gammaproteobacteria bacterium]